jgi:tRNA (guanine37-N1)-methyltransferase
MAPRIDILTLFPEMLAPLRDGAILGAARGRGALEVELCDIRAFATDRHHVVDDAPYGGGDGMVLKCEPVVGAIESVARPGSRILAMSPRGRVLDHAFVRELAGEDHLILLCGRYAGLDERILEETGAEELSIGDYVLFGGEAAAWVVTEAVARLIPGVLGNPVSAELDSFSGGLLEHPVYTRPAEFRGRTVPPELLAGNHAAIERFRRAGSLRLTAARRPDLLVRFEASLAARTDAEAERDRALLRELRLRRSASS